MTVLQTYLVGGAVRDRLMGLPVQDHDWVVLASSPEEMMARGFLPVGRDFPVFLHPDTKEEYALARTERKTAKGYHGFAFYADSDVTLEQDLARRDLTINAIAQDVAGVLTDPYHGVQDIERKILRHVSPAFAEDPVRILRLARFYARFSDFTVAEETRALMRQMVLQGEVDALVPERVWQEVSRGLMEKTPSRMFTLLREVGALKRLLPEVDALWGVPQRADYHPEVDTGVHVMMVLDKAAQLGYGLDQRFACLMHDLGKATTPPDILPRHLGHEGRSVALLQGVCARWAVPKDCKELATVVAGEHGNIHRSQELGAPAILRLLKRCDALRRPERFLAALDACECDARGRLGYSEAPYPQKARLAAALQSALALDTAPIAAKALQQGCKSEQVGKRIDQARECAIEAMLSGL